MNIVLTLDYELFFGEETGSVAQTIVEATEKLLAVLDEYDVKAVFFVDAGFLKQLNQYKSEYPQLAQDYTLISEQLKRLSNEGHELQLHVHPHWEDSTYKQGKWIIDAKRYKLNDWSAVKVVEIVTEYKQILEQFTASGSVFAYRAGGFCIQPFDKIKAALKKNDIWLDSTVFEGGYNESETHFFDFRSTSSQSSWNFENKPLAVNKNGSFLELPIASHKVSPLFYWKLAYTRVMKKTEHQSFGDGHSLPASGKWLLKKLSIPSTVCASIDGYKSTCLHTAFKKREDQNCSNDIFVIIGHPKALTTYSLKKLKQFIENKISEHNFNTFSDLLAKEKIEIPNRNE